jgi:hypothetical protein
MGEKDTRWREKNIFLLKNDKTFSFIKKKYLLISVLYKFEYGKASLEMRN